MFLRIITVHINSHTTSCIECVLKIKRTFNERADGHCYTCGFVWIEWSSTFSDPYFCFDESFSYRLSMFSKKMKKTYQLEVGFFCKMYNRVLFFLIIALHLSGQRFQMPLKFLWKCWQHLELLMQWIYLHQILLAKDSLSLSIHLRYWSFLYFNPRDHADLHPLNFQHHT